MHVRGFVPRNGVAWQGLRVYDGYAGYKASFTQGIVEVGCAAHARKSEIKVSASRPRCSVASPALWLRTPARRRVCSAMARLVVMKSRSSPVRM
jgi:hypothetical protein